MPDSAAVPAIQSKKWLLLAFGCLVCWGVFGFISKLGSRKLGAGQMQVLFTFGTLPLLLPAWWRARSSLYTGRAGFGIAMFTGGVAALANVALFSALKRGPASLVAPVTALYPMVTFLLAVIFLKERMNRYQYFGVVLALAAIFLLSL